MVSVVTLAERPGAPEHIEDYECKRDIRRGKGTGRRAQAITAARAARAATAARAARAGLGSKMMVLDGVLGGLLVNLWGAPVNT